MFVQSHELTRGSRLALLSLAILLVCGIANATWVYHRHTATGSASSYFNPTVSGNHYNQAKAPSSGSIASKVYSPTGATLDEIQTIYDGNCQRNTVSLSAGGTGQHQLVSDAVVTSGIGEAWVAETSNGNLPTCIPN